jgi:Cysteine dioxygenase type I
MTLSVETVRNEAPPARALEIAEYLASLELPDGRLSLSDLERVVASVASRHELYEDLVVQENDGWSLHLFVNESFGVKIESWGGDHLVNWHDHGGSSGAFAVTAGTLVEQYRLGDFVGIECRHLRVGDLASFGADHVHDVYRSLGPAVSVHAYSPPLTGMTHYEHSPQGFVALELVPEALPFDFEATSIES